MIRRDALKAPYVTDYETCLSAGRAGYRYGWALNVRAHHLGWDDFTLYPSHLAGKLITEYREVQLIERAPTLAELAVAGPVVGVTRALGVPDASVLDSAGARRRSPRASPPPSGTSTRIPPQRCRSTPAPPAPWRSSARRRAPAAALVREACRVATHAVVAVAPLSAFDGATAAELAPAGWTGREADGPGDVTVALARWATEDPALAAQVGVGTLEHREQWLALFAAGAFGPGARRLWIWERDAPAAPPHRCSTTRRASGRGPRRRRANAAEALVARASPRSRRREGRLLRERLRILRTRPSASER